MKGADILAVAQPHVGEAYVYGARVDYKNAACKGPWDCAEFASWCVYQAYGFFFGCDRQGTPGSAYTGLWKSDARAKARIIEVHDAIRIPGSFLLRFPESEESGIGHIVMSVGDGTTCEAADTKHGVINGTVYGRRWDIGVLLPGVDYGRDAAALSAPLQLRTLPQSDPDVKQVQLALQAKGYNPGPIDGLFGPSTQAAIVSFQVAAGLVPDGEVGSQTWAALFGDAGNDGIQPSLAAATVPANPIQSSELEKLRGEYVACYAAAQPKKNYAGKIAAATDRVIAGKNRYATVGATLNIPWYVIGLINELESTSRFTTHLHNGDPLTARTVQVPAGRPVSGNPPFTWEESAEDALTMQHLDNRADWRLSTTLYRLEAYNGFGSRRHNIFTPYLWSGCQLYDKGKYRSDGKWDPELVSDQIGCAVIMKELQNRGLISPGST